MNCATDFIDGKATLTWDTDGSASIGVPEEIVALIEPWVPWLKPPVVPD
jgi:hypothetical protein